MKRFNNQFNFMVILDRIKKIGRDWLLEGYFVSRMWNAIIDETVSFLVLFLNFDLICFWSGDRHVPDWKDRSIEKGLEQKEEREREREEERKRANWREQSPSAHPEAWRCHPAGIRWHYSKSTWLQLLILILLYSPISLQELCSFPPTHFHVYRFGIDFNMYFFF